MDRSSFHHKADDIKNCSNLATFKRKLKENKNILKSISITKASCSIPHKSLDFIYF